MVALARIVDEGLLIALSAVRMAVKNDIIVGALGEHTDYDTSRYTDTARGELMRLATENQESAERVRHLRKVLRRSNRLMYLSDDQIEDLKQFRRRRRVHARLAVALLAVADDEERVALIVTDARKAASEEIGDAVRTRLITLSIDPNDPDYEEHRAERTEMFLLVDLALLKLKHAESTGSGPAEYEANDYTGEY